MAGQQYYDAVGNNEALWDDIGVSNRSLPARPVRKSKIKWLRYLANLRGSRMEVLRQLAKSKRGSL